MNNVNFSYVEQVIQKLLRIPSSKPSRLRRTCHPINQSWEFHRDLYKLISTEKEDDIDGTYDE